MVPLKVLKFRSVLTLEDIVEWVEHSLLLVEDRVLTLLIVIGR